MNPKDGRSKSSFMHLQDIQPFIDTTTNKANFPFWPSNVAKYTIDKSDMQGQGTKIALSGPSKTFDRTHYKEEFNNP